MYRLTRKLPIFFHNFKNYDQHLLIHALAKFNPKEVTVIAQTMERYMCMRVNNLVFLDSINFLNASLDSLVQLLHPHELPTVRETMETSDIFMFARKGVYPYEYMTSWEVFEETQLPPMS